MIQERLSIEATPPSEYPSRDTAMRDMDRLMRQGNSPSQAPSPPVQRSRSATSFVAELVCLSSTDPSLVAWDPHGCAHRVERAAGCLLAPQAGDLASLLLCDERCWVVTVLHRPPGELPWVLDANAAELHIRAARVRIEADEELQLRASHLHSEADLSTHLAGERRSQIAGSDCTRAGSTLMHTDQLMSLHARTARVTASALLKLDAAQIHMG